MAYTELIGKFNRIRSIMRDFYVFGYKSRKGYTEKSNRTYDDDRRRLESWLKDSIAYQWTEDGKIVYISVDTRTSHHNPLYRAWKSKGFQTRDIVIHFYLFDLLWTPEVEMSQKQIHEAISEFLNTEGFETPLEFDSKTLAGKLKEYVEEGLLAREKRGRTFYYRRAPMTEDVHRDVLNLASEIAPCGVIGSYLLDKSPVQQDMEALLQERFSYKHHYITGAIDSEILLELFLAIGEHRYVALKMVSRAGKPMPPCRVVPLEIWNSAQNGRQYVMAYVVRKNRIEPFRLDHIESLNSQEGDTAEDYPELRNKLEGMKPHVWGVSTQSHSGSRMEQVEFTIRYDPETEGHIPRRLEREKRCGQVDYPDSCHCRFSAEVYDVLELVPWIRTYICRITEFHCSDQGVESKFRQDLVELYQLYGVKEEDHAVQ